jgi:hypothetical protein
MFAEAEPMNAIPSTSAPTAAPLPEHVAAAKLHAMYQIANAPIREYPFPHICVEHVFPAAFYEEALSNLPADEGYTVLRETGRVGQGYSTARLALFPDTIGEAKVTPGQRAFWSAMFQAFGDNEFGNLVLGKFQPYIEKRFAAENAVGRLKAHSEVFMMRDLVTYSLGPHTDNPKKLVSMLFYLPTDDDRPELGTAVYVPKDRKFDCPGGPHHKRELFDHVKTMPYHRNTVVAFPKTPRCFHGVELLTSKDSHRDIFFFDLKGKLV